MQKLLPILLLLLLIACKKEYSFEQAAGEITDSSGQCQPVVPQGQYRKGSDGNNLQVQLLLNITKTGQYRISTDMQNGISFSASGSFTQVGRQSLLLKGSGVAITDTITVFRVSFGNSHCHFPIRFFTDTGGSSTTTPPPVINTDAMEPNTWWFYDSTQRSTRRGRIDSSVSFFSTNAGTNRLRLQGWPCRFNCDGLSTDSIFIVQLYMPQPTINAGYYPVGNWAAGSNTFQFSNHVSFAGGGSNSFFYFYEASQSQAGFFGFTIKWVRENGKLVRGSFSGTCNWRRNYLDAVGDKRNIRGEFLARLR
jgi:hypothetical protein